MSNFTRHLEYPTPNCLEVSFLTAFNCVNAVTGLIGNAVVCILAFKYHFLRMRAEILLGNLAVADMLVCALAQPMYVVQIQNIKHFSKAFQVCRKIVTWCATLASVNNIFLISLDRFLAVTYLQRYRAVMTTMSLKIVLGAMWTVSVVMGISAVFSRKVKVINQYYVMTVLIVVFCLCTKTLMTIRVKAISITRRFKEADQTPSFHIFPILNRERTLAKTVGVIVGVFYVCFLPLVILPFCITNLRKSSSAWRAAWRAFPWVNTIALCGSSINPYIYYWRSVRFRMALKTIRVKAIKSNHQDMSLPEVNKHYRNSKVT